MQVTLGIILCKTINNGYWVLLYYYLLTCLSRETTADMKHIKMHAYFNGDLLFQKIKVFLLFYTCQILDLCKYNKDEEGDNSGF